MKEELIGILQNYIVGTIMITTILKIIVILLLLYFPVFGMWTLVKFLWSERRDG